MIVPILPLYAQTFDVGPAAIGGLLALQAVPRMFVNMPAGRLADRLGAHRLLTFSCGLASAAALGCMLAPSFAVLALCRVFQGVASAISHTAGLTYSASLGSDERRGRRMSLYQGSFLLGNGIGPVLGGVIAQQYGYRTPFGIYAIAAVLIGIWVLWKLPDPRGTTGVTTTPVVGTPPAYRIRDLVLHGGIMLACLMGLLSAYTRSGSRDYAMVVLSDLRGLLPSEIGVALSLVFLANVAVLYLAGALVDRYGPRPVMVPSWLLIATGLIILATVESYAGLLVAAAFYGIGAGIGSSVPAVQIANAVGPERRGTALGVFRTFSDLGLILGAVVMGLLAATFGITWGVWTNAGLVLVAAAVYLVVRPRAAPGRDR
jgi:MFS family permease